MLFIDQHAVFNFHYSAQSPHKIMFLFFIIMSIIEHVAMSLKFPECFMHPVVRFFCIEKLAAT